MLFLDFETRSRVPIERGGFVYAEDDSTELLCGVALDTRFDPAPLYVWTPWEVPLRKWQLDSKYLGQLNTPTDAVTYTDPVLGDEHPAVIEAMQQGVPVVAHNAWGFDQHVAEELGYPKTEWKDSLQLVNRAGLPGKLHELGLKLYGLGKDERGKKVLDKASKPLSKGRFLDPDGPRLSLILRYCVRDVLLMAAAWHDLGLGDVHPDDETLAAHFAIHQRGVLVDVEAANRLLEAEAAAKKDAREKAKAAGVDPAMLTSPQALSKWLQNRGWAVTSVDKATVKELLSRQDLDDQTRAVLTARQAVGVTGGKIEALKSRVQRDGRMRGILAYCGAHTGRWAGRGFQPQNLPRPVKGAPEDLLDHPEDSPEVAEDTGATVAEVLGSMLRGLVLGNPLLAIADYAAIEARVLLWLAADEENLDVYRSGQDAYVRNAAKIYGVALDKVTPAMRQVGKVAELALGYQGAVGAFAAMARGYGLSLDGLDVPKIVLAWRDSHVPVAGRFDRWWTPESEDGQPRRPIALRKGGLWKDTQAAAWAAVQGQLPPGLGQKVEVEGQTGIEVGRVVWYRQGPHLKARLPSGRDLTYREAAIQPWPNKFGGEKPALTFWGRRPNGRGWGRMATFGGRLVENTTQAVARDLLAHALVECERRGLRTVLHVHDEIVCEVDSDDQLVVLIDAMQATPEWAAGCPVKAEGHVAERYGKG